MGAVSAVALSRKAKGKLLATAGVDKLLKVWDVAPVLAADWGSATGEQRGGAHVCEQKDTHQAAAHQLCVTRVVSPTTMRFSIIIPTCLQPL